MNPVYTVDCLCMHYTSTWYRKKILDLLRTSPREDSFQDFIVYPLLDSIISNASYEVVDSKNFAKNNTLNHDRRKYSLLNVAVPDLLIAQGFVYNNRKEGSNSSKIICAVEVKEPNSNEFKSDNTMKDTLYLQIFPYLYLNSRVIVTNIKTWSFYKKDENKIKEILNDCLGDIDRYIDIQRLCGFDLIDEQEKSDKEKKGRGRYVHVPTFSALQSHWEKLCEIINNDKSAKMSEIRSCPEIKNLIKSDGKLNKDFTGLNPTIFSDIAKQCDKSFIKDIKEYVNCCSSDDPIVLIDSSAKITVNKHNLDSCSDGLADVTDISIPKEYWNDLIGKLKAFLLGETDERLGSEFIR